MGLISEDVDSKYYGCGLVAPDLLEGTRILDLGSGSGRDCFVLSKLVGQKGHVTGLDMTDEQLEVARRNIQYHTEKFGYSQPNVDFVKGYMEKLGDAGLKDNTFDIIISNCVINLSPDKDAVIKEAHRVLKDGGEFYFSDVYADRELPDDVRKHKVLWGECIAGALYWVEFLRLARTNGFCMPRLVTSSKMTIDNPELEKVVGDAKFVSATYRMFKLPEKRSKQRNVFYEGGIDGEDADVFVLDHHTLFPVDEPMWVDRELATILMSSRFKEFFTFEPESKDAPPCAPPQTKSETDPFLLAAGAPPPPPGGCCPTGAPPPPTGGCCPTGAPPPPTGGCCPTKTACC